MARPGDSGSHSPAGSHRSDRRRHDDRYVRDQKDGRERRRSRSRSRERARNDREAHRARDRPVGRREDDAYRPRRDRSRDRRRSRSPRRYRERDRRDRSRDRDYRDRRDDSRDRRRRRDDSTDSRRSGRRDGSRERRMKREEKEKAEEAAKKATEEEKKKADRLAKLEAWKAKQAAKAKEAAAATSDTRSILQEMDKKAAGETSTSSPRSPTIDSGPASPAPYAGKFDPKAIARKAIGNAATKSALGDDITMKVKNTASATSRASNAGARADKTKVGFQESGPASDLRPLKAKGNVSAFGFRSKNSETDVIDSKKTLDLAEEETIRRNLEELPPESLLDTNHDDAVPANGTAEEDDEDDDDEEMIEGDTEEEQAAAARAAAEKKREERLQNEMALNASTNGDVHMADAAAPSQNGADAKDEEDIDPLDAFMLGLKEEKPLAKFARNTVSKKRQQEPEPMYSDAEDDIDTAGANPDDILAMASKRKKKDIPTVNHAKVDYQPFRKNFYSEPTELSEMTEDEVSSLRMELDGIKVRGVDVPKPVTKWAQCGLGVQTLDVIRSLGYDAPTSIQSQALPAIMSGRDVIGVAKTGSGKTIAFLLPMFRHIKDQAPLQNLDGPIGLVLAPTRELATQIHRECKPFLKALGLRAVCAYGGAPIKDQIAELKRGAEIVVCTPGRMVDLLAANSGRVTNLRRVTYCVLDEADRMFDMGFEPQVMKILANIRPQKQMVLFSATFPRNMEALARKTLSKPVEIIVGGRSVVAPEITQIVEVREEETKFFRLLELFGELFDQDDDARALVFVERQESADRLLSELMKKGYPCDSIHGGKDQVDRDSVINDFKNGVLAVMTATSVAARGLDVKQLKLVVNYDSPNHLEDYVHRAGRTGRAGNTGTAVTFITPEQDRYSVDIAKALKQSGQPIPEDLGKLVDGFLEKVKAGTTKAAGSGFGGKGLERLQLERDAAKNRERRAHKVGDEPEDEEEKKDSKEEEDIIAKATGGAGVSATARNASPKPGLDIEALQSQIVVHKTEAPEKSTSQSNNPLDRVRAAVANIDNRLTKRGQLRPGQPIDNKGPDAGEYHTTLGINDFPQKARWAVTNRTNVAKILEATGTSITTKGSYYPPGKQPQPGEADPLYILVEGDTELVVKTAMTELLRLLKEGTVAAADTEARTGTSGRYNVV